MELKPYIRRCDVNWIADLCAPECRAGLSELIQRLQPQLIVEIGSFVGASALHMAEWASATTKIICVDLWSAPFIRTWLRDYTDFQGSYYQTFLSNVAQSPMGRKIIPFRASSAEAFRMLSVSPDLVYIDGNHEYSHVLNDLTIWWSTVRPGGVLCGDDYLSLDHPGVTQAVNDFAAQIGVTVQHHNRFYWFDRNVNENL